MSYDDGDGFLEMNPTKMKLALIGSIAAMEWTVYWYEILNLSMAIFQVVQTPESRSMTLCGITSVLPGEAQTAPGSFIWMDNSKAMEQAWKKITRFQLAEQLSLDKIKIQLEGASKPLIVLDQVRLQKLIFGAESYQRVILQHSMQTVT